MEFNNPTVRETLLSDRNHKLEATLRAYDSLLNTGAADAMRRRLAALEIALADVLSSGAIMGKDREKLEVILGKKFH